MMPDNTYTIIATNLIKSILSRGGNFSLNSGTVSCYRDTDCHINIVKDKNDVLYVGDDLDIATRSLVSEVGAFKCIGLATVWFREHRE